MSADDNGRITVGTKRLVTKVTGQQTKLTELESEIQDIERKLQGGEFRGDEGQIKLDSQLRSLKTKLTELRNEGTTLESETRELQSETRGVLTKLQSEFLAFWDVELKAANYLMIAHAAGLVTCVTLLKDYKDNAQLKGVGLFVLLFGYGLTTAIIAFLILLIQRALFLNPDVKLTTFPNK